MGAGRRELGLRRSDGEGQDRLSLGRTHLRESSLASSYRDLGGRQMDGPQSPSDLQSRGLGSTLQHSDCLTRRPFGAYRRPALTLTTFKDVLGLSPLRKSSPGVRSVYSSVKLETSTCHLRALPYQSTYPCLGRLVPVV